MVKREDVIGVDFSDIPNYQSKIKTLAKTLPLIEASITSTDKTISFDVNISDVDSVGMMIWVELYKDNQLHETFTEITSGSFINLLSNSQYYIRITYTYDLHDGNGIREMIIEKEVYTSPSISIGSVNISNTFDIFVGDSILYNIYLDIDASISIESVSRL